METARVIAPHKLHDEVDDMKVIVDDKDLPRGMDLKKLAMNEDADNGGEFMGRVGGKYDFIMMVGDGTVYGFEGREIIFTPVGDLGEPIGFQWQPVKGKDVDFSWLPLDDEYGSDEGGYGDGEVM